MFRATDIKRTWRASVSVSVSMVVSTVSDSVRQCAEITFFFRGVSVAILINKLDPLIDSTAVP